MTLSISVDVLKKLVEESSSREAAHPLRTYTMELHRTGLVLRVCDRSTAHPYSVMRPLELDALALSGMDYAKYVFNLADDMIARALDSLSKFGGRESVA